MIRLNAIFQASWLLLIVGGGFLLPPCAQAKDPALMGAEELDTFFSTYCFGCHGDKKQKADLSLQAHLGTGLPLAADREIWAEAIELMIEGEMPPENKPQPSPELRTAMIADLTARVAVFDASVPDTPGRVTVRRLNREEYNRTIRDLLAIDFRPADDFPPDEVSFGFDNIGDALTISPLLMEKYLDAAEAIADQVIVTKPTGWPPVTRMAGEKLKRLSYEGDESNLRAERGRLGLFREGEGQMAFDAPADGEYRIRIRAYQDRAGPEPASMAIKLNQEELERVDVINQSDRPMTFTRKVSMKRGAQLIAAGYMNNFNSDGDRNLFVQWIEVEGPLGSPAPPMPEAHRRVIPDPPPAGEKAHARALLRDLASRAWRRPATEDEAERLGKLVDMVMEDGENFSTGMQVALQAVLASPNFLFRWELDGRPAESEDMQGIGPYALASRLSYFLWSSMPDEQLFARAADGSLTKPEILQQEALRLLRDPRSEAFIKNFSGQWLQTRNLDTLEPGPGHFP